MKFIYKKVDNLASRIVEFNVLHNEVFNRQRSIEKAKWEFLDNPFTFKINFLLLDGKNSMVGHWGIIPHNLVIENLIVKAGKIENTMISSDYRGKGLYKPFEKYCSNKSKSKKLHLWSISSIKAIKLRVKLGYFIVGNFRVYQQCLINSNKFKFKSLIIISKFFLKEMYKPQIAVRNLLKRIFRFHNIEREYIINQIEFKKLYRQFEKIQSYEVNTMERSPEYMRWRFQQNPNVDFKYYQSKDSVFFAIVSNINNTVTIHDMGCVKNGLFYMPNRSYLKALEYCMSKSGGVKLVIKSLHGSKLANFLVDNGYFISKQSLLSKSGTMVSKGFKIINPDNWYFTNIFSEGIK
jgi:hypothetical protein